MTGETTQGRQGEAEATRIEELRRADEAAAIDDDLDAEVGDPTPRSARPATVLRPRSQVYSIRVPVERLEQLRQLAKGLGVAPTVMIRGWVLERLDAAADSGFPLGETHTPRRRPLPPADSPDPESRAGTVVSQAQLAALVETVGQLSRALATCADALFIQQRAGEPAVRAAAPPSAPRIPAALAGLASVQSNAPALYVTEPGFEVTVLQGRYLHSGLAELRSTVERVSRTRGMADQDLGEFYVAADEEMSLP